MSFLFWLILLSFKKKSLIVSPDYYFLVSLFYNVWEICIMRIFVHISSFVSVHICCSQLHKSITDDPESFQKSSSLDTGHRLAHIIQIDKIFRSQLKHLCQNTSLGCVNLWLLQMTFFVCLYQDNLIQHQNSKGAFMNSSVKVTGLNPNSALYSYIHQRYRSSGSSLRSS